MRDQEILGLHEAYNQVYQQLDEKENSEYEKASDAALDARYGYGRASGPKTSFGRAANRSSAAAALRAIRRGVRSGSGTSREAGADAVHQGWAQTARTSADQTPEKKARRATLAATPYSNLPDDEKEKDRVSFDAVRAVYNRRNQREETDLFDYFLEYLVAEGYADTNDNALVIMANMSEEWREEIIEARVDSGLSDDEKRTQRNARLGYRGSKDQDIGNMTRERNKRYLRGKKPISPSDLSRRGVGANKYLNMQDQKSGKAKSDVASYHGN